MNQPNRVGSKYGHLLAIERLGWNGKGKGKSSTYRFLCDCGRIVERRLASVYQSVKRGNLPSCQQEGCPYKRNRDLDLPEGHKIGKLTVVRHLGTDENYKRISLFRCECGKLVEMCISDVLNTQDRGCSASCGSKGCKGHASGPAVDYTGMVFGKLTAIEPTNRKSRKNCYYWKFRCECGRVVERVGTSVASIANLGKTPNCGKPGCEIVRTKLPEGTAARNALVKGYKRQAEARNLEWELSYEEATSLFEQNCFYCGEPPRQIHGGTRLNGRYVYKGIDRLDNSVGYVPGNVVSCCKRCNWAKLDWHANEFVEWIEKVHQHLNQEDRHGPFASRVTF